MLHRSIDFDVFSLRRKPRVDYVSFLVQRNEALLTVGFRWWLFCNLRFDLPLKDRIALKRGFSEWYLRNLDNKRIKKVLINTEKWGLNTSLYEFISVNFTCYSGLPNNSKTKSPTAETPAMVKNPCLYKTWIHVSKLFRL